MDVGLRVSEVGVEVGAADLLVEVELRRGASRGDHGALRGQTQVSQDLLDAIGARCPPIFPGDTGTEGRLSVARWSLVLPGVDYDPTGAMALANPNDPRGYCLAETTFYVP